MNQPSKARIAQGKRVSKAFVDFRTKYLFTQQDLATALGISRRAVQYTESGNPAKPGWPCIPQAQTLAKFEALKAKHKGKTK